MKKKFVPLTRPTLAPFSDCRINFIELFKTGLLTNGKYTRAFETAASKFLGTSDSVAVNCGTSAILIALSLLRKRGQVITPSFNFSSPAHSLSLLGFEPVLADMDKETFNIDVSDLESKITNKTVAFLIPHVFGNPSSVAAIEKIAAEKGIDVIFDAAHAFGSLYKGKSIAICGNFSIFSFTPTKVLSLGEGGLLCAKSSADLKRAFILRNNGDNFDRSKEEIGISARMSEFHAVIGLAGLKRFKKTLAKRIRLANAYKEMLKQNTDINFQKINHGNFSVYQSFAVVINSSTSKLRDKLILYLKKNNIEAKSYFCPPLHKKVMYKNITSGKNLKNTDYITDRILSLPLYSHMDIADVEYVASKVLNFLRKWTF